MVLANRESAPAVEGRIVSRVLHAYDIEVSSGDTLYYVLKLSSTDGCIRGGSATAGDRDCVWPPTSSEESFACYQDTASPDAFLEVVIWKSVMKVFDAPLASCKVMLKPLFLYPNVLTER